MDAVSPPSAVDLEPEQELEERISDHERSALLKDVEVGYGTIGNGAGT